MQNYINHFKSTIKHVLQTLQNYKYFYDEKLKNGQIERKVPWPERIYNSHFGNGVPAMFTY